MSYFFSTPVDIDIVLEDTDEKAMVDMKLDKNRREKAPLYSDGESVKGAVTIRPKDGKRLEHTGIKVQFIGTIGTRFKSTVLVGTPTHIVAQRCSLTEAITTSSYPWSKSWPPPVTCSTLRTLISILKTWKSNTNRTTASMSSYATSSG